MSITSAPFGSVDGQPVERYTIENEHGVSVSVLSFGAIVHSVLVPDAKGARSNVVLGYPDLADYQTNKPYFGCVAGRYANRIGKGQFTIDGKRHQTTQNDGQNTLHGGERGFNKKVWTVHPADDRTGPALTLTLISEHGEEGFPGSLDVKVTYVLTGENGLQVTYSAVTDRPTVVNLTQHTYFNLGGEGTGTALDHELTINASRYTPVDAGLITTGELAAVDGTPFDFRESKPIGRDIRQAVEQLRFARGYDHNFVLDRPGGSEGQLAFAARALEPTSGRALTVHTTEPGLQFYSGNFLDGSDVGTSGCAYRQGDGFALETQHFPDSPNKPHFPNVILRPDEEYRCQTVFAFS